MLSLILFFPSFAFAVTPVTPYFGPLYITFNCCLFGDSRSDCTKVQSPMSLDNPQNFCPNFSLKSSSSMFFSIHYNNHSSLVLFDNFNCRIEKVYYNGVNLSPRNQYSCYDEGVDSYMELKTSFNIKLNQMATILRCIKLIQLKARSSFTTLQDVVCRTNKYLPNNPTFALLSDTVPTWVQFVLPDLSGKTICIKYLVPFCHLNHGCFTAGSSCPPFGVSYVSDSFNYGFNDATPYIGLAESHDNVCDYLFVEAGTHNASIVGNFLFYPTKSYCFNTMNFTVPVQAIQSIWSEGNESDDAIAEACKPPFCIYYSKTTPYTVTNGSNADHRDDEVRMMVRGLLYNSSCISAQGSTPLALYSTAMLYAPIYGSCPQYVKLFDTSGSESVDVISSSYFVATWVLLVVVVILIFVIISFFC
uniref:Hemagglutinin-esterase n=1 Tax=Human torovirus TaxID=67605 RepID=HEMA_HUTV|nr:RecName: Full=Hemagglutinin-esterase; Short=HE protein; AltName: Full=E3 glycoprotein; Flags: Precursor [Human torovirus]AAF00614.1 hemagglutinin-esterase [Human torovirus]